MSSFVCLILDNDPSSLADLTNESSHDLPNLVKTSNAEDFLVQLKNEKLAIVASFIDADIGLNVVSELIKSIHQLRPGIGIAFISKYPKGLNQSQLSKGGVDTWIQKPLSYPEMFNKLKGEIQIDLSSSLASSSQLVGSKILHAREDEKSGKMIVQKGPNTSAFVSIPVINCLTRNVFAMDIYVLVDNKIIKYFKKGESVPFRKMSNIQESSGNFYVSKKDHEAYVDKFDLYFESDFNSIQSVDSKLPKALTYGKVVYDYLKSKKLNDETLEYVVRYVEIASKSVFEFSLTNLTLRSFLTTVAAQEHAVSHTMLAGLILKNFNADKDTITMIGTASYLHDIDLYDYPNLVTVQDLDTLTPKEKDCVLRHPEHGAAILKETGITHPDIIGAILGHHRRLGGKGFPKDPSQIKVNRYAEIIGICDLFLEQIRLSLKENFDPAQVIHDRYFDDFSLPVQNAFREAFIRATSQTDRS